ncbi:MAG: hypothetical protein JWM25_108 [Thermoleophilia bacterium]|nr:hypothetical protein [Thermoleophilia bacterium]
MSATLEARHSAQALGHMAPFVAITSLLVEPTRYRGWAYVALLTWAGTSVVIAIGNLQSIYFLSPTT